MMFIHNDENFLTLFDVFVFVFAFVKLTFAKLVFAELTFAKLAFANFDICDICGIVD